MTLDPSRFAAVYAALWAAHDLGDHVVQTDHQAAGKSSSWRCMAGHVGGYGATQAVALGLLRAGGLRLRPARVLAGLAVSLGTHAFLDRRWPVVRLLERTGSARFAAPTVQVDIRGTATPSDLRGRLPIVAGAGNGPLPLHGPYLADQALHHVCVALAAAVMAGGRG